VPAVTLRLAALRLLALRLTTPVPLAP